MSIKREIVAPKKGMNTDKAVFDRAGVEYSFALNANFHDEHGSGDINLQNEPSNVLCSGFKTGYKVVGHKYDVNSDKTYFFLTNPTTGCSEIGYIANTTTAPSLDYAQECKGCGIELTLENPLEGQTQTAMCAYTTMLTDECNGNCDNKCLNFSVDYPIHESNVVIKTEKTGTNMYFNAEGSPRRYIQLDNLSIYNNTVDPCTGATTTTCLQCDKMRVDKLFKKPCVTAVNLQNGGALRAGTYEVAVAYATSTGDEISNYFSKTNPVSIHDENNNILDQTNLDYRTNKAIKVTVMDMDDSYDFYKVAVIYKSGLALENRVYDYGTFPVGTDSITISSVENKEAIKLSDLFRRTPFYSSAKGLASSNGYLFHYGMKAQREVNLQPVVSLMGMFVEWGTVAAKEDLYKDGADVSNYRGYMRDENYPAGIQFFGEGGYETAVFNFIPRPPKPYELHVLGTANFPENNNTSSITEYVDKCDGNDRNKRWQFENTATIKDICPEFTSNGTDTITIEQQLECFVTGSGGAITPVAALTSGTINVDLGGATLADYINQNTATIIASTEAQWAAIKNILANPGNYPQTCTPSFQSNCGTPTLVSQEMQAIGTTSETVTHTPAAFGTYTRTTPPASCSAITGTTQDTTFRDTYMRPSDTVYDRNASSNTTCSGSLEMVEVANTPATQIDNPFVIDYKGAIGSNATLLSAKTSSATATDFSNKVHTNAVWYKVTMSGQPYMALEMSTLTSQQTDSVHTNRVRMTVFKSCADTSDMATYTRIISDITLANDTNKYLVLTATDFPDGVAYIAVDTPISEDKGFGITLSNPVTTLNLTGASGTANINVGGTDYLATFNTDLATTASDFVTAHASTISSAHNVTVTAPGGGVLSFTGSGLGNITITNATTDLAGTVVPGSITITIDGNTYAQPFDTNLTTTAANFVSTHSSALQSNSNISVSAVGAVLNFRSTAAQHGTLSIGTTGITGTASGLQSYFVLLSPGGCINIHKRQVNTTPTVTFSQLTFSKKQLYKSTCTSTLPKGLDCKPVPHRYGDFGYYESTTKYPCNKELYDSSTLTINRSDLPTTDMQTAFESNYVASTAANGDYTLNANANFRDKPIRHYRFPSSALVPFMSSSAEDPGAFNESIIYPIGFRIDEAVIRAFLNIAVKNGLLTVEERARIKRYEIFRGDRTTDKSIIAKGLLFDMYKYTEASGSPAYYPNYPLNALGQDLNNGVLNHIGDSNFNNMFTFHSPDTHHNKPTLPNEMMVEGYQFGSSAKYYDEVKDHARFTILGDKSVEFAEAVARAEVGLKVAAQISDWVVNGTTGGISSVAGIVAAAIAAIAHGIAGVIETGGKRYEWMETVRNLGHPKNHAYYNATIGHYNYMISNTDANNLYRGLPITQYLTDGRLMVADEVNGTSIDINNFNREESVYIGLGKDANHVLNYPDTYKGYDVGGSSTSSRFRYTGIGRSGRIVGRAASPYASLKQFVPDQYGSIYSIDWISTNACGNVDGTAGCKVIFGGDIFISRFSVKRKFPVFTNTAHGLAPLTPFKYSDYFNINPGSKLGKKFVNYRVNEDSDTFSYASIVFPSDLSEFQLDGLTTTDVWYIEPPAKFYLYYYGFPYFLVESPINSNFRYAKRELHENFYPNFKDVLRYTQESDVSISEPNTFFYNDVYSLTPTRVPNRSLPVDFSKESYEKLNDLTNTVVYSAQDNSEQELTDPWLVYKPLDAYQFPTSYGQLIDMDGIESEQVLGRFENGLTIFGAIDMLRDRLPSEIGSGGIFSGRNINFNETDLGYAGTQHIAKVSCEFGHFWVDAKRGEVFKLNPNGKGLEQITEGMEKWFKEHLPFKIAKRVSGVTQSALDNAYKGLGIAMGWDARLKRVFITKKDYVPKVSGVTFANNKFMRNGLEVQLTDTTVFEDCSFTIAYSPLTKTWISYYSFKPNYYVGYENYFQTGINNSTNSTEFGLWSHLSFLSSYQVFYGTRYPFTIEMPLTTKQINSTLHDLEYWLDVRKYYNKYDYTNVYGKGLDEAYVYNSYQNTGKVKLIMAEQDNLFQQTQYPKHNSDSVEVLQTELAGKYSFNYLYNSVRNERSGIPHWKHDCAQVNKEIVASQIDYRPVYKDRLRGDHFSVRLSNTLESRYKMIFRFMTEKRDFVEN